MSFGTLANGVIGSIQKRVHERHIKARSILVADVGVLALSRVLWDPAILETG